jgi:anti-anti-sigma regulatory factor
MAEDPPDGTEATLRRQHRLLLRVAQSAAIDGGDLAAALPLLTEVVAEGVAVERASIWLYDDERTAIVCHDLFCRTPATHARGAALAARDFPGYFAALAEARTISAADAHTDPATREFSAAYLEPLGIGAMLEAPIRRHGRLVGVLCSEHVGGARRFTADEEGFAASIAEVVARAYNAADARAAEAALAAANASLAALDAEHRALIERLREAALHLAAPVLEVWDGVLAVPVIGALDATQGARLGERVMAALVRARARQLVLDFTGLERCDAATADTFLRLVGAVRLLGVGCTLCGLHPATATALVELGADLSALAVRRDLRQTLQEIVAAAENAPSARAWRKP